MYLFACLVLGGSAQGIWQNMVLQLAGIAIIAWAAASRAEEPLVGPAKQLLLLAIVAIAVVALQMVPLPPAVWSGLGPRHNLVEGYRALGLALPALPLSLTPGSFARLVARAHSAAGDILRDRAIEGLPPIVAGNRRCVAGTVAGILLGALQVASASSEQSPWYLYEETNLGTAVGFFANANHMADLLVVTLPFLAAIAAAARRASMQRYSAVLALAIGAALLMLVGLALNGSLAGYGLALPSSPQARSSFFRRAAACASGRSRWPVRSSSPRWSGSKPPRSAAASSAAMPRPRSSRARTFLRRRRGRCATSCRSAPASARSGKSISFTSGPTRSRHEYVIHAHNDYAELALETGAAGIVLMLLFLAWWAVAVWRVWRTAEAGPFARAASIASAAMLVHSLVDFPLRTAAISACFAMCLALLADRRAPAAEGSVRPAPGAARRHPLMGHSCIGSSGADRCTTSGKP